MTVQAELQKIEFDSSVYVELILETISWFNVCLDFH